MPAALAVTGLRKRFGRTYAVDGITLEIPAGTAVALFGPNGAGKTTFLRLCSTLLRPTAGSVTIFGDDAFNHGARVRNRLGVLGHDSFLYPDLTPMENLLFYARLFRIEDPLTRVRHMLERLRLVGWSQRPVRTLSRGLMQRCALARALLHRPALLLLDEPFSGLDIDATADLNDVLAQARDEGTTIVVSTHDLAQGLTLCSSALVLTQGRVGFYDSVNAETRGAFIADYRRLAGSRGAED